jgi:hypothetical protein
VPQLRLQTSGNNEVQFRHAVNYRRFKTQFGKNDEAELRTLEKYYAARLLIEKGCNRIYVNAVLMVRFPERTARELQIDVCGIRDERFVLVFCESARPTGDLYRRLEALASITNVEIVLLYPFTVNSGTILDPLSPQYLDKVSIEQVPWMDDDLEDAFQEAMKYVNLLCNETRVRMLLPLLKETRRKGEYRTRINPKLVYENLANLIDHNLLDEFSRNEYTLTPIGKQILGEYLAFIQRVKRTIKEFER